MPSYVVGFLQTFTLTNMLVGCFVVDFGSVKHLHEFIVPDDLYSHFLIGSCIIPGTDDITEHTLPSVAIYIIALI